MLSIKALRENLLPLSPQAAIDHWIRVFDKHGENPEFENPRVQVTMRSGVQHMGYLVAGDAPSTSRDRYFIMSLVTKIDTDQARDVVYLSVSDVESVAFYDIDPILSFMARK